MAWRLHPPVAAWALAAALVAAAAGLVAVLSPIVAVLLALGLAFLWLALLDLTIGLCAFVLISASLEVLPGLGDVSFARLAGAVLVVSWIGAIVTRPGLRPQLFTAHPVFATAMVLFALWSASSVLWAEDTGEAMTVTTRYALNFCLIPIVYTALAQRRHAIWYVWAFAAGVLLSAAYGMIVTPGDLEAAAEQRASGAGLDPNYLATLVVGAMALLGAIVLGMRRAPRQRLLALGGAALCMIVLLFTVSRTGLAATLSVMVCGIVLAGRGRRLPLAAAGVVVAGSIVLYFAAMAPDAATRHITSESGAGRNDLWVIAGRMIEAEPVHGVGAGNFRVASIHYLLEPGAILRDENIVTRPKVAHNVFLEVQAELGIVGLGLFVGILAFCVICALRAAVTFARAGDREMEWISRGTAIALLGMLTGALFNSLQYTKPIWLVLALGPALLALAREASEARAPT